jgi:hypothetical protein
VRVAELERLSFREQAQLMASTAVLVGVHGAGLANALLMPHGAVVLELCPHRLIYPLYEKIATSVGLFHLRHVATEADTEYAEGGYDGWSTRQCYLRTSTDQQPSCIASVLRAKMRVDNTRLAPVLDIASSLVVG